MEALTCHSSFGSHVVYGDGRSLNRRFSQVGSESGWRAAETNVAKSEAQKRGITLKIADGQQKQENQIKAVRSFIAGAWMPSLLRQWWRQAGNRF